MLKATTPIQALLHSIDRQPYRRSHWLLLILILLTFTPPLISLPILDLTRLIHRPEQHTVQSKGDLLFESRRLDYDIESCAGGSQHCSRGGESTGIDTVGESHEVGGEDRCQDPHRKNKDTHYTKNTQNQHRRDNNLHSTEIYSRDLQYRHNRLHSAEDQRHNGGPAAEKLKKQGNQRRGG